MAKQGLPEGLHSAHLQGRIARESEGGRLQIAIPMLSEPVALPLLNARLLSKVRTYRLNVAIPVFYYPRWSS